MRRLLLLIWCKGTKNRIAGAIWNLADLLFLLICVPFLSREKRRIARKRMENKKEVGLLSKSVRPPLLQRLKFTEYGSGIQSTKNPCGFA